MLIEKITGFEQLLFKVVARNEQNAVLHVAVGCDDNQQHPFIRQTYELDLTKNLGALRSQNNPGKLRQVGQQRRSSRNSPARLGRRQKLADLAGGKHFEKLQDRKSTRLNSSH